MRSPALRHDRALARRHRAPKGSAMPQTSRPDGHSSGFNIASQRWSILIKPDDGDDWVVGPFNYLLTRLRSLCWVRRGRLFLVLSRRCCLGGSGRNGAIPLWWLWSWGGADEFRRLGWKLTSLLHHHLLFLVVSSVLAIFAMVDLPAGWSW